jgi:hypothetical protein
MLNELSTTEKIAAITAACVVAALGLILSLKLRLAPSYSDFIVGNVTWNAATKVQDLIAGPVFIFVLIFGILFFLRLIKKLKNQGGGGLAEKLSSQLIWWAIPSFSAFFSLVLRAEIDEKILLLSAVGIIFISIASVHNLEKMKELNPELFGLAIFSIMLISILPLEIALVLGRSPIKILGDFDLSYYLGTTYFIFGCGVVVGLYYALRRPEELKRILPKLVFLGQVGLPALFLTLYPARLLQPSGELTKYETTVWLKLVIAGVVLWAVSDVVGRYRRYSTTTDWFKLLSPMAFFALLVGLRVGSTVAPSISPDDYHFGERLLGWWSYLQGTIPYSGYIPAHGLVADDLSQFMSSIFYDGSAGSVADASRLGFVILAFLSFMAIYYFSGSLGLAFVSTFYFGWRFSWFFLTAFFCLWFSQSLRGDPSKWLIVWMVSAPIVILGVPPQGLLLVAASGVMAAYYFWLQLHSDDMRFWAGIGLSFTILSVLGFFTPLGTMLFGAIRYVLENGSINQVAYGLPWDLSWTVGTKAGFVFEAIRMSWVAIPIVCLIIIFVKRREFNNPKSVFYPAVVVLVFTLLLIPYSMGRIDPGNVSRPGSAAIFSWAILLPIIGWMVVRPNDRASLVLLVACMSALLNYVNISFAGFFSAIPSTISTALLRDGKSAGLANIGTAYVQDDHWDRLTRLNALLSARLSSEETYLDLTSRNAQYFYLNRRPVLAVTAPYNMVLPADQMRAVVQLSKDLPTLALLEGNNVIHDGGGLALRNPYLYRFIVDNYIPSFVDGFIIGYKKTRSHTDQMSTIDAEIKDVSDENWNRGFHRTEAAIVVSDPILASFIKVGDQIRIWGDEIRKVSKVVVEGGFVWLEGDLIASPVNAHKNSIHVVLDRQAANEYWASLFQMSFSKSDIQKIPVAWGKSEKSLKNRMKLYKSLDKLSPTLYQLIYENRNYTVIGPDPSLSLDISSLNLAGHDAGLLRFDFTCTDKSAEPKMQVFWWGDAHDGPFEASSVKFTADNGTLIIPLDASPLWLTLKNAKGIRIDLDNGSACGAFFMENIGLFQRVF